MPQPRKYTNPPRKSLVKKHVSQISVSQDIIKRCNSAMELFFKWRKPEGLEASPDSAILDEQLGSYVNYLYQNDMRLYLG